MLNRAVATMFLLHTTNKPVFSFLCRLTMRHCTQLLLSTVLRCGCCWSAARWLCSNRSISPARRALSSKPAAAECEWWDGQTEMEEWPTVVQTLLRILCGQCKNQQLHPLYSSFLVNLIQQVPFSSLLSPWLSGTVLVGHMSFLSIKWLCQSTEGNYIWILETLQ